jgi:hypothetical protein
MKKLSLYIALLVGISGFCQSKLITKTGKITFEASVPAFEEVKAKNESVTCVLNTNNGEIAILALIKGFRFKIALMEEHFNENYIESDTYPKATFKGKVEDLDISKIGSTFKEFTIKGKLEIHGKSKEISIIAKIKKNESGLEIDSNFYVNTEDFDIDIPSVVSKKVSKKVNVTLDFVLK